MNMPAEPDHIRVIGRKNKVRRIARCAAACVGILAACVQYWGDECCFGFTGCGGPAGGRHAIANARF